MLPLSWCLDCSPILKNIAARKQGETVAPPRTPWSCVPSFRDGPREGRAEPTLALCPLCAPVTPDNSLSWSAPGPKTTS